MYFDQNGLVMVPSGPSDPPEHIAMPHGMPGIVTEYNEIQCILADGGDRFGVSCVSFDKYEELLWMGNQGGHVTSYYTGAMTKYTSFQAHKSNDIRHILTTNENILILSGNSLRLQIRRGIPIYTHSSQNMMDLHCMLQVGPDRILLGGQQDKLIEFNLSTCKETNLVDAGESGYVLFRTHSKFVCAGTPLGRIDLLDVNSLRVAHTLQSHTGSLSDFDIQGNLLVTCGFSHKRHGSLAVDRFLMVFDIRMLKSCTPIQTVVDPMFLRFLPSVSSRLAVVSRSGEVQLLDTITLSEPRMCLFQVPNPGECLSFDISPTSQAMAFGNDLGSIHLFSTTDEPVFNAFPRATEHADDISSTCHSFAFDDYSTPLSSVPMPILPPGVALASDWPDILLKKVYRKPPGIDPEILGSMKMQGTIGYAPNPRTCRRNQVAYDLEENGKSKQDRSNQNRDKSDENGGFVAIPKRYRKLDMRYTKLGTDDFQFDQYNKTKLCGLESTLPNAYCNAMLQVLYYTEPLRANLISHLCYKEFCLSCELGFLFYMLSIAQGQPCQPTNFLRAFRTVPEASALGLILSDLHPEAKAKVDLSSLIQSWNRFMLHQMHVELVETKKRNEEKKNASKFFIYKETDFPNILGGEKRKAPDVSKIEEEKKEEESDISQLFGTVQLHVNRCLKCNREIKKESILLACNLIYPLEELLEKQDWSFSEVLSRSMCPRQVTPAWCDQCKKFSPTSQSRQIQGLPRVLSINTALHHAPHKQFWQSQMDRLVAKATGNVPVPPTLAPSPVVATPINPSPKLCRYGDACTRPGCRFRHSRDSISAPQVTPSSNLYCSNNWLPHKIRMRLKKKGLVVENVDSSSGSGSDESKEEEKEEEEQEEGPSIGSTYNLSAVVCYINDQTPDRRNLVALIRIPGHKSQSGDAGNDSLNDRWYLFNDFSICKVPAQEAVWFSLDWKVPCVLYYSSEGVDMGRTPIYASLTKEVFDQDECISRSGGTAGITFTPLTENEMPKPGELVAMDAEFVTLNQEEAEVRSDGKMATVKPSQMSVARITCIRGQGALEGTPFIDDYISTQEQVVDYLTRFSGIKPGDLDANFSSKHLTTLKSTYAKLRFLQDSGVVFVGHHLRNDFRVINLVVPPEQVVDTVCLFRLPHERMVSLKFLAWHFLGLSIQSETHDSVEDARTALELYKKYLELETSGIVAESIAKLYETGKMLNWKVPEK